MAATEASWLSLCARGGAGGQWLSADNSAMHLSRALPCWSPAHKADPSFHRRAPSRASFCVRHTKQLPDSPMTSYERVRATHVTWCVHSRELHATTPLQRCRATTGARAEGALASAGRKWKAWLLCSGRHAAVLVPMDQEPRRDTLLCCLCQCLLLGLFGIISSGHGPLQWTPFKVRGTLRPVPQWPRPAWTALGGTGREEAC